MKKKPLRQDVTVALWVFAISGWAVVLGTNNTIGLEALWGRAYRVFDPPPEDAQQIVDKLDQFAWKRSGPPLELEHAGVSPSKHIRYLRLSGGEYELNFALDDYGEDVWTYTSWNRKWRHWKMISSGG